MTMKIYTLDTVSEVLDFAMNSISDKFYYYDNDGDFYTSKELKECMLNCPNPEDYIGKVQAVEAVEFYIVEESSCYYRRRYGHLERVWACDSHTECYLDGYKAMVAFQGTWDGLCDRDKRERVVTLKKAFGHPKDFECYDNGEILHTLSKINGKDFYCFGARNDVLVAEHLALRMDRDCIGGDWVYRDCTREDYFFFDVDREAYREDESVIVDGVVMVKELAK